MNVRVPLFCIIALLMVTSSARADLLPNNFWLNSTFELGTDLDQTNGTPANWTRGGGDTNICQVTTNKSESPSHSLAVIDNNVNTITGFGEWYSDVDLIGIATSGQVLDIQWFEMYSMNFPEMRLTVQFFNSLTSTASSNLVGETHFITSGTNSDGWVGNASVTNIANSAFTKRNGSLIVPCGAVKMRCALVSAGYPGIKGVMVIDDLSVAVNPIVPVVPPTILAGNFFPNPTFELGSLLDHPTNASQAGWTKGGSNNKFDQVTTSNSVSPTHSLSLVDNSLLLYGEWYQYLNLCGEVAADDVLDVQFFRIYNTTNTDDFTSGSMRLTFGFRDAAHVSFGPEYNFEVGGQSPGWLGSVAASPFERVFGRFLVPAGTAELSVKFASGGAETVTGTMVIDDLSVRISIPVITSITAAVGSNTITWLSMPSKLYTVQFATNLSSPTFWMSLTNGFAGDLSLTNSYPDTVIHAGKAGFYRVVQE